MPSPVYGVIGRGRWGTRIASILAEHHRRIEILDVARRGPEETVTAYQERVDERLRSCAPDVRTVWLAVPPTDQAALVRSALDARKNVIVEKPWLVDENETQALARVARDAGLRVAVHHQFCYLDALRSASSLTGLQGKDAVFSGEFAISRKNRLNIPARHNLGSHLMAIKCLYFPRAQVGSIRAGYNCPDSRWIDVKSPSHRCFVDFLDNREPLIQRFIDSFEQAIAGDSEFPVNLELASRVRDALGALGNYQECD